MKRGRSSVPSAAAKPFGPFSAPSRLRHRRNPNFRTRRHESHVEISSALVPRLERPRGSVQRCRLEQLWLGILWDDPALKCDAARTGDGEQVAIPCRWGGIVGPGAVGAMVLDELSKISHHELLLQLTAPVAVRANDEEQHDGPMLAQRITARIKFSLHVRSQRGGRTPRGSVSKASRPWYQPQTSPALRRCRWQYRPGVAPCGVGLLRYRCP